MKWTEEMDATLKASFAKFGSCREIAGDINAAHGTKLTRNAVIGRLMRLGLSGARADIKYRVRPGPAKKVLSLRFGEGKRREKQGFVVLQPPKPKKRAADLFKQMECLPLPAEDTPPAKLIAVADLEAHHCRWVYGNVGEPVHGFCGEEKIDGLPYCLKHARKAFQPSRPRTDVHYVIKERRREFA